MATARNAIGEFYTITPGPPGADYADLCYPRTLEALREAIGRAKHLSVSHGRQDVVLTAGRTRKVIQAFEHGTEVMRAGAEIVPASEIHPERSEPPLKAPPSLDDWKARRAARIAASRPAPEPVPSWSELGHRPPPRSHPLNRTDGASA